MSILSEEYELQDRQVVVCKECRMYADIPATIVHAPRCSLAPIGAQLTKRTPDRLWRARGEGILLGLILAFFIVVLAFGGR